MMQWVKKKKQHRRKEEKETGIQSESLSSEQKHQHLFV